MAETPFYKIPAIYKGLSKLLSDDPVFKKTGIKAEDITRPATGGGYDTLVKIVIGQQVSTSAAASMWNRLQANIPNITPQAILAHKDDDLRAMGLSRQKVSYIREMAQKILDKHLDLEELGHTNDEEVAKAITSVKGFGPWSAEIYLMFGLARPDVWPAKDLGIQDGLKKYHQLTTRPNEADTKDMGKMFRPHRTAASLLLWHYKTLDH